MNRSRRRRRRPSSSRARRRRLVFLTGIVALVVVAIAIAGGSSGSDGSKTASAPATKTVLVAHSALAGAISGEAVVATKEGPLILGGLDSASNSAGGVFQLDVAGEKLSEAGSLTGPLHDAAANTTPTHSFTG